MSDEWLEETPVIKLIRERFQNLRQQRDEAKACVQQLAGALKNFRSTIVTFPDNSMPRAYPSFETLEEVDVALASIPAHLLAKEPKP